MFLASWLLEPSCDALLSLALVDITHTLIKYPINKASTHISWKRAGLSSLHVFHRQLFQLLPLLDSSRNARGWDWSFTVFSQFGWICFKAWFAKWEKFDGKLAIASEDFDIHESCFTNPSRQSHKACHNLPLPALSIYSLNIAFCPFGIY